MSTSHSMLALTLGMTVIGCGASPPIVTEEAPTTSATIAEPAVATPEVKPEPAPPPGFTRHTSRGGYSLLLPCAKPEPSGRDRSLPFGAFKEPLEVCPAAVHDGPTYMTDYWAELKLVDEKKTSEALRDEYFALVKADYDKQKLAHESRSFSFEGVPAVEFIVTMDGTQVIERRFFALPKVVGLILVHAEDAIPATRNAYFESVDLTP